MAGFVYVVSLLTLGALLAITGRQEEHEVRKNEEIFRYDAKRLKLLLFMVPIPTICDVLVFFFGMSPTTVGIEKFYPLIFGSSFSLFVLFSYFYLRSVVVTIDQNRICIENMFRARSISLSEVREILLVQGDKDFLTLVLKGTNGKLAKFGDSFGDLRSLCSLIRLRTTKWNATFKYRDGFGKWYSHVQ